MNADAQKRAAAARWRQTSTSAGVGSAPSSSNGSAGRAENRSNCSACPRVTVATSKLHDAGVIMLAADAAPAGGKVYQLWTIRSQQPVNEGALAPGQTTSVQIVNGMSEASDVGVSIEPPGGSTTPTTPLAADVKL